MVIQPYQGCHSPVIALLLALLVNFTPIAVDIPKCQSRRGWLLNPDVWNCLVSSLIVIYWLAGSPNIGWGDATPLYPATGCQFCLFPLDSQPVIDGINLQFPLDSALLWLGEQEENYTGTFDS